MIESNGEALGGIVGAPPFPVGSDLHDSGIPGIELVE